MLWLGCEWLGLARELIKKILELQICPEDRQVDRHTDAGVRLDEEISNDPVAVLMRPGGKGEVKLLNASSR